MNSSYTTGPVSIVNSSYDERLYCGDTPDTVTEINRYNYIDAFSQVMEDDPSLVAEIKDKKYRWGKIGDIITQYRKFKQTSSK